MVPKVLSSSEKFGKTRFFCLFLNVLIYFINKPSKEQLNGMPGFLYVCVCVKFWNRTGLWVIRIENALRIG
jgi:hypothetical protein